MTITRLLVANRGEIARRVFRTCRDLGIGTVAVHSDADAAMPFVREADVAVLLPGNTPAETYLRGDLVIEAARRAGADAIHPGYGFLSENADFARAVVDAGLTWVGPSPESIEAMGSKIRSKELMAAAGVPVLRSWLADEIGGGRGASASERLETPLLVKASAGGGGRGMRIVRDLSALPDEIATAESEAASAFGDGTVFVEPYVETGRHVEVQVLGTPDGALVLGERDCSVQRRHQKVIEEAPAPGLPEGTRQAMYAAAKAAAEAIDYRGAGTVEFLYDPVADRFFFLEMNTRLQVEHPVTELVTGLDLVALQIAVAEGRPVDLPPIEPDGHAVEVRFYAEDPAANYQPQSGRISRLEVPGVVASFGAQSTPGIRLDSGVGTGDEVGTFYDAMIAKVIAWAPTREEALRRLAASLERAELHGLVTNRDLLVRLLRDPVVVEGRMHTTWLDGASLADLGASPVSADDVELSAFAAAIASAASAQARARVQARIPAGFRTVVSQPQTEAFERGEETIEVRWLGGRAFTHPDRDDVTVGAVEVGDPTVVTLAVGGITRRFTVYADGASVDVESAAGHVALRRTPRFTDPADHVAAGSLLAPMPGSIIKVMAEAGDQVDEGQPLVVMEAMKMQHTVAAPTAGTVTEIDVSVGDQVAAGDVLAVVEENES